MPSKCDYAFKVELITLNKVFLAALFMCCSLPMLAANGSAQTVKLTVSYTGVGPVNLPVVLAKEAGLSGIADTSACIAGLFVNRLISPRIVKTV